jgi:putative nucleotidyltransferase with HDIG domain
MDRVITPLPGPLAAPAGLQPPRVRMPLRAKITLPYLILALCVAVAAAYVVTKVVIDSVEERFTNQLIETGKIASEAMVKQEAAQLASLRLLAHTVGMAEAIQAGDAERLRVLAYPVALNGLEEAVEILSTDGELVLALRHRRGDRLEAYDFTQSGAEVLQSLAFVQPVAQGQADDRGDKYAGLVDAPWGRFFYVSGPVYDRAGQLAGIILVGRSVETLAAQLRQASFGQVSFYGAEDELLATTLLEAPSLDAASFAEIMRQPGSVTRRRSLVSANIAYTELLSPWEVRGDRSLGVLGIAVANTFLVRTNQVTRGQITTVVAVALLLIVLIGWYIARRITIPLLGMVQATTEVAHGNLAVRLEQNSNDEVALLAQTFNYMVSNLQQSKVELVQAYDNTLAGWSKALDLRDRETEGHTQRVTEMTVTLARAMGCAEAEVVHLRRGALLHDIGKMGIPDGILRKPGPLTEDEWVVMKKHPTYAYDMLASIEYLRPALDIPHCHHEKWDGTGYPQGLQGTGIPLAARLFAVVDVWDALCSTRPYREAWDERKVMSYIQSQAGLHFDPAVVAAFIQLRDSASAGL